MRHTMAALARRNLSLELTKFSDAAMLNGKAMDGNTIRFAIQVHDKLAHYKQTAVQSFL